MNENNKLNIKWINNKLQDWVNEVGKTRQIILTRDCNRQTGSRKNDKVVGHVQKQTVNDNGERQIEFCQNNYLRKK